MKNNYNEVKIVYSKCRPGLPKRHLCCLLLGIVSDVKGTKVAG